MNPQLNPSTSSSSISTRGGAATQVSPDGSIDGGVLAPYINESESGIEASLSSMGDEEDEDDEPQNDEPSLLQRAVRSARRSSHKHKYDDFMKPTTSREQTPGARMLESLPKREQAMAMAGIANATDVDVSASSSSSTLSEQQRQRHIPSQDIPTPSSGYDGDTEGTMADQREQLHRHHRSLHDQLVRYSQLHQSSRLSGKRHMDLSSGNVSSS
ncbi:hypothetical protein BJV82DRAFT_624097 [Fennellomyces sp. T-0311]|nr:hypothetical protein BJV82DRAFT_624097 [Fennellomyces sp. T-0311]